MRSMRMWFEVRIANARKLLELDQTVAISDIVRGEDDRTLRKGGGRKNLLGPVHDTDEITNADPIL